MHGAFPTREGGVSAAPFDSLNLGLSVGDDADAVLENRRRFCAAVGPRAGAAGRARPGARHDHGLGGRGRGRRAAPSTARASSTTTTVCSRATPGLGLVVSYADCVPVVIVASGPAGPALAAVHAGWRGMLAGIVGKAAA